MESGDDQVELQQNREEEGEKINEELSGPDPRIIHQEPLRLWAERKGLTADRKSPSPSFLSHSDYDRHSMLHSSKTEEIRQAQIQAVISIPLVEKYKALKKEEIPPIAQEFPKTQKSPPKVSTISWVFSVCCSLLQLITSLFSLFLEIFFSRSLSPAYLRELMKLKEQEKTAKTYSEWSDIVEKLDVLEGKDAWKENPKSDLYDFNLIELRLKLLRGLSSLPQGYIQIKDALRAGLYRNLGGIGNRGLHMHSRIGTKKLISDYIREVCIQLKSIQDCPYFSLDEKYEFFFETRQSFGRTALLFSGGAALGMYHLGVVKALHEQGLLPSIMSGSSAGSIVASAVGVLKDDEIPLLWQKGTVDLRPFTRKKEAKVGALVRRLQRLFRDGVLLDVKVLEDTCRENIGDLTFREAYLRTGKVINIIVCSEGFDRPRLLNYLTAPNVLVWSAACASCALKFLYKPVELLSKEPDGKVRVYHPSGLKWSDGSVEEDLPMKRLSELFNVNHFIVSQVNPHVYPFIGSEDFIKENESLLSKFRRTLKDLFCSEIKHRVHQIGVFPFSLCKLVGSLANQTYRGDVTVVPKMTVWDFLNIISNPDEKHRLKCIESSEKITWKFLSLIKSHTEIELALEECFRKCQKDLAHPLYSPQLESFT